MTRLASLPVTILYGQLGVFSPGSARPGRLWTDDHVAQGFAWSPGAVSFGIPDHDGDCRLEITEAPRVAVPDDALWSVKVPFTVSGGGVHIGSIVSQTEIALPEGPYDLVFTARPAPDPDQGYRLALDFVPSNEPTFAILLRGEELTTDTVLRTDSEPG